MLGLSAVFIFSSSAIAIADSAKPGQSMLAQGVAAKIAATFGITC